MLLGETTPKIKVNAVVNAADVALVAVARATSLAVPADLADAPVAALADALADAAVK